MVSFIVPVYNMEKYVNRCIDSILNQNIEEWELIAIDDGSRDKSSEILDEYAQKDSRIRVIHKGNEGIAGAVRDGLGLAQGDYIAFVDSDDYINNKMLQTLQPFMGKYDIIQFGMVQENEDATVIGNILFPNEELEGTDTILQRYFEQYRMPSMACRIFKKKLFENIVIEGRNIGIDEMVTLQLMGNAKTLISINNILYHIYIRSGSVSRNVYSEARLKEVKRVHEFLWDYVNNRASELKNNVLVKNIQAYMAMYALCEEDIFEEEKKDIEIGIQKYRACAKQGGSWKDIRKQLGMGYTIYSVNHKLYRTIQQYRRR